VYTDDFSKPSEKNTVKLQDGKGTKIKDMQNVMENLKKYSGSSDELQALYRVMFGKRGKKLEVKKHIYEFNGLVYGGDKEKGREKVFDSMGRWTAPLVKELMNLLGVKRAGKSSKEDLMDTFIDWLENPVESTSKRGQTTPAAATKKRKRTSAAKSGAKKAKTSSKKKKDEDEDEDEGEDEDEESEDEADDKVPIEMLKKLKAFLKKTVDTADRSKLTYSDVKNKVKEELGVEFMQYKDAIKSNLLKML